MLDSLLQFSTNVLTAGGPRRRPDPSEGVSLGSVTIPKANRIVGTIIAFGQEGNRYIGGTYTARLTGQPVARDTHLEVSFEFRIGSAPAAQSKSIIPYPSEQARALCRGEWVTAGIGAVRLDPSCLMPTVKKSGEDAVIVGWDVPPQVRLERRLLRWVKTGIVGIRLDPFGGELLTESGLANWILPRLVWGTT